MTTRQEVLNAIRQHDGHHHLITVPRVFITLTGDPRPALLLSQLLYWTDRASSPTGWVYKTREEWAAELGLTRHGLYAARNRLRELGFIDESLHLVNNKRTLHLRLCGEELLAALKNLHSGESASTPHPSPPPTPPDTAREGPQEPYSDARAQAAPTSLLHAHRLLARRREKEDAEAASAVQPVANSSDDGVSADRSSAPQSTGRPEVGRPVVRFSDDRCAVFRQTGVLISGRPRTETTP